jgi:formiminotetrahydrofolate cyclodeaminase
MLPFSPDPHNTEGADMAEMQTKAPEPGTGNQGVQLGVGTLIIIALIVTMCSGRSEMEKIQKDTAALKQQIEGIDKKLDTLVAKDSAAASTGVEASDAQNP